MILLLLVSWVLAGTVLAFVVGGAIRVADGRNASAADWNQREVRVAVRP